jgi:signal transduction histidine kinase
MANLKIKAIDIVKYLLFFGIALRAVENFSNSPALWNVILLLVVFLLLFIFIPVLHQKASWMTHMLIALLTGIIILLSLQPVGPFNPPLDYFVVLFVLLIIYTGDLLNQKIAFYWDIFFILTMAALMIFIFGVNKALQFIIIYTAVFLFVGSYVFLLNKANKSEQKSRDLLTELKTAHSKLMIYASQAKELAIIEERNRLARELHDSVTQTIFSMTLTADSARILLEKDPIKVAPLLDRLHKLAQGALAEMRTLIAQLRPKTAIEGGLIKALNKHLEERKTQDDLEVELKVEPGEEIELSETMVENLYRITQEALNNISKHSQTNSAIITLKLKSDSLLLLIEDQGVGFDLEKVPPDESHLGLIGMRERVNNIDATFTIESKPGHGTKIKVEKQI